jgi:RHS repeat-associated protein
LNGIIGFTLEANNTTKDYYYIKNIFNDVIEIIDDEYNIYAKYSYDIFGKCNIITNLSNIANINPIRYRSYYYDNETGLYYLNTRYYDPETMRFISLDGIEYLDYDTLGGLNLFVYCNNNPVMYSDGDGHLAVLSMLIFGTLFGLAAGFGVSAGKQLIENDWDFSKVDWGKVVNSTIVGGVLGFSFAMGVVYLGPVLAGVATVSKVAAGIAFGISVGVSYAAGSLGYATEEWINDRSPNFGKAMLNGGFVALEGAMRFVFGGITGSVGNIGTKGKFLKSREWWAKLAFGQEFTFPFKYVIDLIRRKF